VIKHFVWISMVACVVVSACAPQAGSGPSGTTPAVAATAASTPKIDYPTKPVSLIVGFAPGGPVDQVARGLVAAAKPYFPQPIVVVNKPGASGALSITEVMQSKPDGYTIGINGGSSLISPYISDVPYKGPGDWRTITMTTEAPFVFAVLEKAPWKTLPELITYAKANPGKVRIGVTGAATPSAFVAHQLNIMAGVEMTVVPFTDAAESMTAFLGGHVEALTAVAGPLLGSLQAGSLRFLATYEEKRNSLWANVPTLSEVGYKFSYGAYHFLYGPKDLPDNIVAILDTAIKKAVESDEFKKFAQTYGYVVTYRGPADATAYVKNDDAFTANMVKRLGLGKK
jgi:tripartite-type tricarboxylate transporter receptor subunit TctC